MKDWEKELLRRARKIFRQGEGEINFAVRRRADNSGIECIIKGGDTVRFIKNT
jgi:hypothetical protein